MKNLSNEEKQILLDLMPLIDEDAKKKEDTIRAFKWLANVPQVGMPYEQNKNVYELQDKGIEAIKNEQEARKQLLRKLIEDLKDILEQTEFSKKKLEDERKALLDENIELKKQMEESLLLYNNQTNTIQNLLDSHIKLKKELEDYKGYQEYIAEKIYNGDDEILTMGQWEEAGKPDATE